MSSKKLVSGLIYLLVIPLVCFGGIMFFRERFYSFVTAALAILTVAGYFLHFEKKHSDSTQLVIIAAMTALSVFGRIVFSFLPGFKPCTAIVIITALYMGRESGFMTGAMTALISNFYFGQGAWTPFQMLVWGLTGYFAGMLADKLIKSKPLLVTFGIISRIYSQQIPCPCWLVSFFYPYIRSFKRVLPAGFIKTLWQDI